jgi:hypothetical protein
MMIVIDFLSEAAQQNWNGISLSVPFNNRKDRVDHCLQSLKQVALA